MVLKSVRGKTNPNRANTHGGLPHGAIYVICGSDSSSRYWLGVLARECFSENSMRHYCRRKRARKWKRGSTLNKLPNSNRPQGRRATAFAPTTHPLTGEARVLPMPNTPCVGSIGWMGTRRALFAADPSQPSQVRPFTAVRGRIRADTVRLRAQLNFAGTGGGGLPVATTKFTEDNVWFCFARVFMPEEKGNLETRPNSPPPAPTVALARLLRDRCCVQRAWADQVHTRHVRSASGPPSDQVQDRRAEGPGARGCQSIFFGPLPP